MSSYWTEETVTTVQRTYIKGTFTGKYHAHRQDKDSSQYSELYVMNIYQAEVTIDEVRKDIEGPFPEVNGLRPFKGTFSQPVNCLDPKSGTYFQLNLDEPHIADPQLTKVTKEGNEHLGTVSGTIYGHITKLNSNKVRVEHQATVSPVEVNTRSGWSRTNTHEFSYTNGLQYRRDHYRHVNGAYRWGAWYAVDEGWSFTSWIKLFLCFCFGGLLLAALISMSWVGLIILGIILFAFLFAKIRRTNFGVTLFSLFYGSILLLYVFGIMLTIFHAFEHKTAPVYKAPDKHDYTQTIPVERPHIQTTGNDTGKVTDQWIIHHRSWNDLEGNHYEGDVKVLNSQYQESQLESSNIHNAGSLSDVYRAMTIADEARLNGVYPLFDSLKRANNLDSTRFADMLVSFVQDIPYSKVTDGNCNDNTSNSLSQSFSPNAESCIGNIPYGVQSPVEFMANLQGDCDTRTLFLFTVFNHYHYHTAILGSEAFRHSLLGLELPLSGSFKMAGTHRFILWETTSTGFAAGYLTPRIDQMDYWDFYLINTPTS